MVAAGQFHPLGAGEFRRVDNEPDSPIYKLVGRKAGAAAPTPPLKVAEDDDFIRIGTGAADFEISKKRFNLLNRVAVAGRLIVGPDGKLGSVVQDPDGRTYLGSAGTQSVRILESGPVMVKVQAKGRHVSSEPGAFAPGLYGYEVTLTFWAGQPVCDIEAILTNNSAKPIGEPHFRDWSLLTRLGSSGAWTLSGAGATRDRVPGGVGESALLYQDSVGTDLWQKNTGILFQGPPPEGKSWPQLATFRGYKLFMVAGQRRSEVASGDFADGVVDCTIGALGCTVSPRDFWQQFPSAVQFGGDGVVRLSPFPREYRQLHWLEDATAKAQEFRLCFYAGGKSESAVAAANRFQTPTFALPSPQHCGSAGALSDLGPYGIYPKNAEAVKHFSLARREQTALSSDRSYGNGFGWQAFGMSWTERASASGTNYEPLGSSHYLWSHLLSGRDDLLVWGLRNSRHYRDVRTGLVDDQDNLALWTDWRAYETTAVLEHYSRLLKGPESRAKVPTWRLYDHPYNRVRFSLPNMQHLNLDEVYDLYCLTGDERALRCMRTIADNGMAWVVLKGGRRDVNRDMGWCLRTIARYYDLTHDERYAPVLARCMDKLWHDVDKTGVWTQGFGGFYTAVYARGMANAYRASGDERMRDLVVGAADWEITYGMTPKGHPFPAKPEPPWTMTPEERVGPNGQHGMCPAYGNRHHVALYALAYAYTGDPKYRDAFEQNWKWLGGTWQGYYPASMYMIYGPRPDTTPPAAVTDLAASAGKGEVTLSWSAPGDDGANGTAAVYQIKYAAKPILEFVPHPEKMQTHITFWGSTNVADEPAPAAAGTRQRHTIRGLAPGAYSFALKSRDECSNQSPISNVVRVTVP